MNKIWFRAVGKRFGWEPISWQGWLILLLFGIAVVSDFMFIYSASTSLKDTLINFIPFVILLFIGLVIICKLTSVPFNRKR